MILELTSETPEDVTVIGGKGCGIVRLLRADLPAPHTWCVAATDEVDVDAVTEGALRRLWNDLAAYGGHPVLAVRSSATAEDLEEASFAGVYTTELGVQDCEALVRAVETCRRSLHSDAASVYRAERGVATQAQMAVLVQRLVTPDVSGVMLTANPSRPFADEIVLDASYGLGESVVSGRADPDHLVVERSTGRVRERRIGTKAHRLDWRAGEGVVESAVPDGARAAPCLTDRHVGLLWETARRVTARLGTRQDIEWAISGDELVVLQQRPITGLPPENPRVVSTRKFGDEYLAEYSLPLGFTLMGHWIAEYTMAEQARLMGRRDMEGVESVLRHEGYSYMNGAYVAKLLQCVPKEARAGQADAWFTPLWTERLMAEPFVPRYFLGWLLAPWRDPRGRMHRNVAALERHCGRIEEFIRPELSQDYTALTTEAWEAQMDEVEAFGIEHFRVIRWGMARYNPLLHAVLSDLLRRWAGDEDGALYGDVIGGLPDTHTARINREVWELGRIARDDTNLAQAIRAGTDYVALRTSFPDSGLWRELDSFLDRHGHRSDSREISRPRWVETPDVFVGFIRAQLRDPDLPANPAELEAAAVVRSHAALRTALGRAGRGAFGALQTQVLRRLVHWTRLFTAYRENQRYHLDYILAHLRRLVLEQGRRLAARGVIGVADDVFLVEADELRRLARDESIDGLRDEIETRRRHWLTWRNRLPATYLFDGVETEGEIVEGDPLDAVPGSATDGVGAARGLAAGPVRVVRAIEDLDAVEPGDILVAGNIDPGWTPVFPLLAGVVTTTGGPLSHGALLAREYGIPAVMGVPGATERWVDGTHVAVDGSAGTVVETGPA
ncbi:MAG: phosphoenolpyruvate synthase [Acidimicrobiia bacterium]|nr:phosphoenolpyruvate synthase [Acidimicrobiia bacterium]